MTRLCPECGEPPHYHSFCTRCAKLFWKSRKKCERHVAARQRPQMDDAKLQRDRKFIRAYHASMSIAGLMALLGKPRHYVKYHRIRLGLPSLERQEFNLTSEGPMQGLAQAIADGLTGQEAAARLGRPYSTVLWQRINYGLPPFKRPPSWRKGKRHPLTDRVDELRRRGFSYSQIAAKLGASRGAVAGIIYAYLRPAGARP